MTHRVFTAINIPEDAKNQLIEYQNKIDGLFEQPSPIRWTKENNLHITLEFLGNLSDNEVIKACQDTEKFVKNHEKFTMILNEISYGPPKKMPPRMIWLTGNKITTLNLIPHITLGRIKMWEFRQIEQEEIPDVFQEIDLSFEVESIEVMESQLKKGGPNYTILESCQLKK